MNSDKGPTATSKSAHDPGVIALLGGGEFTEATTALDRELLERSGASEVAVIAAAAAYEEPHRLIERAVAHFDALGARVRALEVYTRRDANDDGQVRAAKNAKLVYLTDGSPMHLRSVLKDTQLLDVLVAGNKRGSVLAASGAGATVLCDPMIDPRGGAYTVGLGLVPHTAVFVHHTNRLDHLWDRAVDLLPPDATLVGIDDGTAIVRDGREWRVVGDGGVVITSSRGGAPARHGAGALPALSSL
jgi:cyanophycinase